VLALVPIGRSSWWEGFGAAGDVDIADFKPTQENILNFHQEAERLEVAKRAPLETPRMR
jgi:hypothetical protein